MFVRKNRNRSGSVSIQIISKNKGKYRVVKTIGTAKGLDDIERLVKKARNEIRNLDPQEKLFSTEGSEEIILDNFLDSLSNNQIHTIGPELIFGTLFDRLGFNVIKEELFRHLVITRLAYPVSKLKTVDYLYRYRGIHLTEDSIYRFLDTLNSDYKDITEKITYEYTKNVLNGSISVVFYDVTTLYFETEDEDDLRKIGFSKDGKFQCPQIMIGLLVGPGGYPIGYDVFEGNTFEGHTLIDTLEQIQTKYDLDRPVVVADAAMLSKKNLRELTEAGYTFILGGRIKNEDEATKVKILKKAQGVANGASFEIRRKDQTRLVVSFSEKRQAKDAHNRDRGIKRLRKRIASDKLNKDHLTNRGYNKFLTLKGEASVEIDEDKIAQDALWDGLKGYVTNSSLSQKKVIENYGHLWQIERAFRISKTDLRVRPVYHYKQERIKAHLCIAFVAYTIWKELERLLKEHRVDLSPKRAGELTHNMYELEYELPGEKRLGSKILKMDTEQRLLYEVIHRG